MTGFLVILIYVRYLSNPIVCIFDRLNPQVEMDVVSTAQRSSLPILAAVLLAGIVGRKSLRGGVAMPSVGVDDYLVRGVRIDWSGHSRKVSCYMYKCTYVI